MKREIKFRAKIVMDVEPLAMKKGYWVEGHYYEDLYQGEWCSWIQECNDVTHYKVDKNTLGQFTGLLDKNGKEIYEGDILGLPERDAKGVAYKNRYIRVVEWINDGFFLLDHIVMEDEVRKYGDRLALEISLNSNYAGIARCFKERGLDYTVIGNIHDNPELLKTE